MIYHVKENLVLPNIITVHVVGAGGTGGEVIDCLARLRQAIKCFDRSSDLLISVWDGDTVSQSNIGRQRFSPNDIGRNKAVALVERYNLFYGFQWEAIPEKYDICELKKTDLLITCVDSADCRAKIGQYGRNHDGSSVKTLWLDFGNDLNRGQVILGQAAHNNKNELFLPNVYDLFPELEDSNVFDKDNTPSCSLAEAINKQDLFINRHIADAGMNLLWRLMRDGSIDYHGVFVDTKIGCHSPLKIDSEAWAFFGCNINKN